MSISIKDFKNDKFMPRGYNENHPLLVFFKKHKRAYTEKELGEKTGLSKWAIRNKLQDLKKRKIIVHKSPMYVYADHLK